MNCKEIIFIDLEPGMKEYAGYHVIDVEDDWEQ